METKEMQQASNVLTLDKDKILQEINYSGKYEESDVIIRKWEGEEATNLFIADIKKDDISYMGILNGKLQRESYGLTNFQKGERYFGMFANNLRQRHGWYSWPSKVNSQGKVDREFYYGLWKENKKHDHGVYLWLTESKEIEPFQDFDNADFDAYIGELANDTYKKGVYLVKRESDYYVFYGSFDENGRKYGDKCFFYNATEDQLIYGKVENDKFIDGYLALFDSDEGTISSILKCSFTYENNKPEIKSYKEKPEIEENEYNVIIERMTLFRNIILLKDYFGDIYKKFKSVDQFIDDNMKNLDVLDSPDQFPQIMQISVEYNNLSIFQDIEKRFSISTIGSLKTMISGQIPT